MTCFSSPPVAVNQYGRSARALITLASVAAQPLTSAQGRSVTISLAPSELITHSLI
jgi:hypothetical protein